MDGILGPFQLATRQLITIHREELQVSPSLRRIQLAEFLNKQQKRNKERKDDESEIADGRVPNTMPSVSASSALCVIRGI